MTKRWKNRPEGSTWGDFGEDDQTGRLALLTPERVRRAAAEIHDGRSWCLSLPLDFPGGNKLNERRHPPRLFATVTAKGQPWFNQPLNVNGPDFTDVVSDDAVLLHCQYSTQWDALAHVGGLFDADGDGTPERVYYNGWRAEEHIFAPANTHGHDCSDFEGSHADRLGIENMAATGVQGRGVMVDLRHHLGDARTYVGYDDLMRVMEADGAEVEEGDMVCFHTGWAQRVLEMDRDPSVEILHDACAVLDGRDAKLLNWVTDSGAAVLIADNYAVEGHPSRPGEGKHAVLPLHEHCLFKLGVHLGELWHLTPLAAHLRAAGRTRFFLTAPPLRLPGAVGSPLTPVATT
ncbi:MAG: cyclase [Rhodobacteraceae bacterium]|nr:cyclase [Paracoccaceae bacterium]MBR26440.1 cyclase [Paracoccaceae bacterium]